MNGFDPQNGLWKSFKKLFYDLCHQFISGHKSSGMNRKGVQDREMLGQLERKRRSDRADPVFSSEERGLHRGPTR